MTTGSVLFDALAVSFAGALLSLDRTAVFQTMVSRPIVAGPAIGWLLGSVETGLVAGAVLELLFMGDLPVGSYVPAHETGIAVFVTAITVVSMDAMGVKPFTPKGFVYSAMAVMPAVLLVALPVGKAYKLADYAARSLNSITFRLAEAAFFSRGGSLMKYNLAGLAVFFTALWLAFFITVAPLMFIARAALSGAKFTMFMQPAFAAIAVLGVASALTALGLGKKELFFFAAGIAASLLLTAV